MPDKAQASTLSGMIMLDSIVINASPQTITFEFSASSASGSAPVLFTRTVQVDASGSYSIPNIPPNPPKPSGTSVNPYAYHVGVKGYKWLRYSATVDLATPTGGDLNVTNFNMTLAGGDSNNDNIVDIADFGNLINGYGLSYDPDDPNNGFDPHVDFNCDDTVDIADFGILVNNYSAGMADVALYASTSSGTSSATVSLSWSYSNAASPTYYVYRSTTRAHGNISPIAITTANSYTDTVPSGTYYYQIVAVSGTTLALSNQLSIAAGAPASSNPRIQITGANKDSCIITGYKADNTTINYQAKVTNGLLSSYKVNGHELFHSNPSTGATVPIQFGAGNDYHALSDGSHSSHTSTAPDTLDPNKLNFTLKETANIAQVAYVVYTATPTNLQMSLDTNYSFAFCLPLGSDRQANEAVYAVQDNPDPTATFGYARLPGTGVAHSLPIPCYSRTAYDPNNVRNYGVTGIRNLHCLFNDSAADFTYALNDENNAPDENELFSYYKNGNTVSSNSYTCWGRSFGVGYDNNGNNTSRAYVEFTFAPAAASTLASNSAPPFHLVLQDNATLHDGYGMYAANTASNYVFCQLQIDNGISLSGNYTFNYTYTDFWGHQTTGVNVSKTVAASSFTSDATSLYKYVNLSLDLPKNDSNSVLSGYFFLKGSLTSASNPASALPNEDGTDLGIYHVMNNPPYIYDVPLPTGQTVEPLNTTGVDGSNPGVSDPGGPRILGMKAVRIDANFVFNWQNNHGVRAEDSSVSRTFDFLSAFSNSGYNANGTVSNNPVDDRDMVLIGSIPGRYNGVPVNPSDVFNMVSSLTYVPSTHTTGGYAANPIKYWSLDNEPGNINLDRYVTDDLLPSVRSVQDAYHNPALTGVANSTPVNTPVVMGPNLVRVEQNYNGAALSWWDVFFGTTYTVTVNNVTTTHYAAELLDAISTHPYTGADRSWEKHGVYESLRTLQGKILNAPYSSGLKPGTSAPKDLWITEHGISWNSHADMPRLQADYIVRERALGAAAGIPHEHNAYYYTEQCGAAYNFYLWSRTPNRGGMAMRILNDMMAGMSYDQQTYVTDTGKYVHVVPYTDGTYETLIAWGNDFTDPQLLPDGHQTYPTGTPQPVSITLSTDTNALLHIYDVMGNDMHIEPDTNFSPPRYTIPVTGSPVYIKGFHGASFSIANQWPTLREETNYARTATPSSSLYEDKSIVSIKGSNYNSGGVEAINDGSWQYDDIQSPGKTVWISKQIYSYVPNRSVSASDYVAVTFPTAKSIDTLVVVVPASNNSGDSTCGIRDYEFQVSTDGTTWTPVKTVVGNRTEWVLYAHFDAQTIKAARLVIKNINNGRWYDDFNTYSEDKGVATPNLQPYPGGVGRAIVYELEAYGPENQ